MLVKKSKENIIFEIFAINLFIAHKSIHKLKKKDTSSTVFAFKTVKVKKAHHNISISKDNIHKNHKNFQMGAHFLFSIFCAKIALK